MHLDYDLCPRIQRAMVVHAELHGGRDPGSCFQAVGDQSHRLIQHRRAETAVKRPRGVAHPRFRPEGEKIVPRFRVAFQQFKMQHVPNGTGGKLADLGNSTAQERRSLTRRAHW
mgnify:CR=1 FL=1